MVDPGELGGGVGLVPQFLIILFLKSFKVGLQKGCLVADHLACRVNNSADTILNYFFLFSQKIGFDISCRLSPLVGHSANCLLMWGIRKNWNSCLV